VKRISATIMAPGVVTNYLACGHAGSRLEKHMVHVALHTRASDDEACSMAITLPMLIALDAALMYQPEKLL
jgi:hypothetical protein